MITDKIKNLFKFIDFLHSNIDNFKKYDEVINELNLLDKERDKLNPTKNYKEKLMFDEIQAKFIVKYEVIEKNIIIPIKKKVTDFNICNFQNRPGNTWHHIELDIFNLKRNFSNNDILEIQKRKSQYIEFRKKTNRTYFQYSLFNELDDILKSLFDFFKGTRQNEFEPFERETIQIDSVNNIVKHFSNGNVNLKFSTEKQTNIESDPPQQISKQNKTKDEIINKFKEMDSKGFEYAFRSKQDFNTFVDILTSHFEYNDYTLLKVPIQLKKSCKTKLAATLGKIHSELSNVDNFSSDTEYFKIVRCLNHYTHLSNDELYKALTRNRKDY